MKRALVALVLAATACTPTLPQESYEDRTGHAHEGWKGEPTVDCARSFKENGRLFCKGTGKWVGWFAQEKEATR